MMMKEKFVRVMLVVVSILLFLNLFNKQVTSLITSKAEAQSSQSLEFKGNGVSITCSDDGKFVYAATSRRVFRSTDFGKGGSWEEVVRDRNYGGRPRSD
jgi:hypothetical protein